MRWLEKRDT
ncbi:uncharacterized, partial [Tachysurus ichikawai]